MSNNNPFDQMMEFQKNIMDSWTSNIKNITGQSGNIDFSNFFDFYKKMSDISFSDYSENPFKVFQKTMQSLNAYNSIYQFWSSLNNDYYKNNPEKIEEILNSWYSEYSNFIDKTFVPFLPDQVKNIYHDSQNLVDTYKKTSEKLWGPWAHNFSELNDSLMKGMLQDPKGYLDFIKLWKSNYDETFSKYMNMPGVGINREFVGKQFETFDKYIQFITYLTQFTTKINEITKETIEKVASDTMNKFKKTGKMETFEEFYKYWSDEINIALEKLFISDDFSNLIGETTAAMMDLKIEFDKVLESYFDFLPISKKSDIDNLSKAVYELKKEVQSLKKELKEKNEIKTKDVD